MYSKGALYLSGPNDNSTVDTAGCETSVSEHFTLEPVLTAEFPYTPTYLFV